MAYEGVHGAVEVQRAPQQQTVLPAQLGNHDRHQAVGEGLAGRVRVRQPEGKGHLWCLVRMRAHTIPSC